MQPLHAQLQYEHNSGIVPQVDSLYQNPESNAYMTTTMNPTLQNAVPLPGSYGLRNPVELPQHKPLLQPSVQINIQPLIKPLHPNRTQQMQQPAPVVYSFGQTDFSQKLLPKFNNANSGKQLNRKVSWGKGESLDVEDDFADILG